MDKKEFCIFLDAGHGGINPKVKLPNGYTNVVKLNKEVWMVRQDVRFGNLLSK